MTQHPHDQMSKQFLQDFLEPIGIITRNMEVPGEPKFIDAYFVPSESEFNLDSDLGLLGQIIRTKCCLEPFRNAPTRTDVKTCLLKLLWVQEDERRKDKKVGVNTLDVDLPRLWILAATTNQPVIDDFGGEIGGVSFPGDQQGIYFLPHGFHTAIVSINQLPETSDTLWLRVLGRGHTQRRAVQEVVALPPSHPRRGQILRLLASWKVTIEIDGFLDSDEQEDFMALSQAFLDWEQQTKAEAQVQGVIQGMIQGEQTIVLRLLNRKFGALPQNAHEQVMALNSALLGSLTDAALDFNSLADLGSWLNVNH
jgi:Domain of unknown function (DUF4351)